SVGKLGLPDIETVGGNCTVQSAEGLSVEKVGGNCKIGFIGNDAKSEMVGGNLSFIAENSMMEINGVGGNLSGEAENISLSTSVGGNIKLNTNRFNGEENQL